MKLFKIHLLVLAISLLLINCGETPEKKHEKDLAPKEEKALVKQDTIKQMNLLDEQAKMLGKVFGSVDSEEGRAFSKVTNYLDLVEQANFPPDVKKNLLDQYKIYELSLDPKKKDSLKLIFNEKLNEAMAKAASNQ